MNIAYKSGEIQAYQKEIDGIFLRLSDAMNDLSEMYRGLSSTDEGFEKWLDETYGFSFEDAARAIVATYGDTQWGIATNIQQAVKDKKGVLLPIGLDMIYRQYLYQTGQLNK